MKSIEERVLLPLLLMDSDICEPAEFFRFSFDSLDTLEPTTQARLVIALTQVAPMVEWASEGEKKKLLFVLEDFLRMGAFPVGGGGWEEVMSVDGSNMNDASSPRVHERGPPSELLKESQTKRVRPAQAAIPWDFRTVCLHVLCLLCMGRWSLFFFPA